jgi:hypothetical protein
MMSYDIKLLGSDDRDGLGFHLIKHLETSVEKGSFIAKKQLEAIENFDVAAAEAEDQKWRSYLLEDIQNEMEEFYSNFDDDDNPMEEWPPDFLHELRLELNDFHNLIPNNLAPETTAFLFALIEQRNEEDIGPFGKYEQDNGSSLFYMLDQISLSPLIPRDLLWKLSDWDYAINDSLIIHQIPEYLIYICISPACSINILKKIYKDFDLAAQRHLWLPLILNPVTDIWLLTELHGDEMSFYADDHLPPLFDNEEDEWKYLENPNFWYILHELLFVWEENDCIDPVKKSILEIYKMCERLNITSDPIKALGILSLRVIQEFKSNRANWQSHIDSKSDAIRLIVLCNPEVGQGEKAQLNEMKLVKENPKLVDLISLLWQSEDLTVIV